MDENQTIEALNTRIRQLESENEELRRIETKLRASRLDASQAQQEIELRYRVLFEKAGDAIFLIETEGPDSGRILDANQAAAEMHGYSRQEIRRLKIQDLDTPQEAQKAQDRIRQMLAGEWIQAEITHRRRDGSIFPVEISAGLITIGGKKVILAIDRDITIRKLADRRLKESEERYRAIFEGSGEGIMLADIHTLQFRFANPAICSFLGYSREELINMRVHDIHPQKDLEWVMEKFQAQARGGQLLAEQIPCLHKEGHTVFADIRSSRVQLGDQSYMAGFFADITQRMGIQQALNEQVLFLQTLIDTLPHPIFYKDNQGRYLGCNRAFEQFTRMPKEKLVGKSVFDVAPKDLAEIYNSADKALLESRRPQIYEASVRYADGSRREVIFNKAVFYRQDGTLAGLVGAMIDITERKRAEEEKTLREKQLRQSQKMEAIGTLAGGIAHDFNNILSGIVGYTEIALHDLPGDSPLAGYLRKVLRAGDRARALVHQIMAFSRSSEQEIRPVVVKHIVKEALILLQATLPSTITIRSDLASSAAILADPTYIHQVLMNLCTNAAHAMQAHGGRLTVTLTDVLLDAETVGPYLGLSPGPHLKLAVGDTGTGMTPDVLDRIFDPFFTTKKPGEGTGMGLAVVHGIVKECAGSIQVQSAPAKGSTFEVLFPAIQADTETPSSLECALPTGNEAILFVDDEPDIVAVGREMLERLGYRVTAVQDSRMALDLFCRSPQDFDLVITDMTMPEMTGELLSQQLLGIRADIPVIICTGYSEKIDTGSIQSLGVAGITYKPLIMKDLAELIRKALDLCKSGS